MAKREKVALNVTWNLLCGARAAAVHQTVQNLLYINFPVTWINQNYILASETSWILRNLTKPRMLIIEKHSQLIIIFDRVCSAQNHAYNSRIFLKQHWQCRFKLLLFERVIFTLHSSIGMKRASTTQQTTINLFFISGSALGIQTVKRSMTKSSWKMRLNLSHSSSSHHHLTVQIHNFNKGIWHLQCSIW